MTTRAQGVIATPHTPRKIIRVVVDRVGWSARSSIARVHVRQARPWLGSVASPLAFVAAALAEQWLLLPLLVLCMWWWAPRDVGCEWIVAVQAGGVGVEWALIGATCFAHFPGGTLLVGALWTGAMVAIAALCAYNRTRAVIGY